jgi:hypothetical protein
MRNDFYTKVWDIRKAIEKLSDNLKDGEIAKMPELLPEWKAGVNCLIDDRVRYNGIPYKVLQSHTSQESWSPDWAPSLFAKILIPDETIHEWEQPDSTNPYMKGDKVSHNGRIWESLIDNNVWEPCEALATLWKDIT